MNQGMISGEEPVLNGRPKEYRSIRLNAETSGMFSQSSIRYIEDVSELTVLFDDDVNIVVWNRELSTEVERDIQAWSEDSGFKNIASVVSSDSKTSDDFGSFKHLQKDVFGLVEILQDLTDCDSVGLRLSRVTRPMCPRFHADRVLLRVVLTYVGTGTEFVSNHHIDRSWLRPRNENDQAGLLRKSGVIQQTKPGQVVFLKGELWGKKSGQGAVHRSPAASVSEPRLLLTLDPL